MEKSAEDLFGLLTTQAPKLEKALRKMFIKQFCVCFFGNFYADPNFIVFNHAEKELIASIVTFVKSNTYAFFNGSGNPMCNVVYTSIGILYASNATAASLVEYEIKKSNDKKRPDEQ